MTEYQIVILDNQGYESEISYVFPHRYPSREEAAAQVEVLERHFESTQPAVWAVRPSSEVNPR